ncbi:uncharacterized protein [Procambarus clarkii]|uniref:uncharacterized protein n=1 Tax=Procambarus clarkii TaxID=6728 RepID=UPI00374427E5
MTALTVRVSLALLGLLLVACGVGAMPARSSSCLSPVDLRLGSANGSATTSIPLQARQLKVSVVLESGEREGVQVARLVPVDVDAPRCTTPSASDLSVYCYKYSEIRWSHLGTHGSDHAVNGRKSNLEAQHYLRRTHHQLTGTPLAVGVLARVTPQASLHNSAYQRSVADIVKLIKNETRRMDLTLGDLLPPEGQAYYQYNGTVPGSCTEETEWLVYDGEMTTSPELLEALKGRWSREAHFDIVDASPTILYASGTSNTKARSGLPTNQSTKHITPSRSKEMVPSVVLSPPSTNSTTRTPEYTSQLVTTVNSTLVMSLTPVAPIDANISVKSSSMMAQSTTPPVSPTPITTSSSELSYQPGGASVPRGAVLLGFLPSSALISLAVVIVTAMIFILF